METQILYWHWLVFGMVLMMAEIAIASFAIFWFGLGALIVAVVLWMAPSLALSWQLFIWVIASSIFALLWFKYFKPLMVDRTKAGIAREAIVGESGQVIKQARGERRGVVRFSTPVLGNDEWEFICGDDVAVGSRVYVKEVSGNTLIVEKQ